MKKTIGSVFIVFVFLTTLVNGCVPVPPLTPVPLTSTLTLISPTNTPTPTATLTKLPTNTVTPTIEPPVITTEFLTEVKILSHNSFETYSSVGIFELNGNSTTLANGLTYGDGVILKFKLQNANEVSGFSFNTGIWRTDSDRGFGIINTKYPRIEITQGKDVIGRSRLSGDLSIKTDTWYNILMAIGKNERFLAVIWDPADESHRIIYKTSLGEKWSGKTWAFDIVIWGDETISIDDFYRISFGEIQ